MTAAYRSVADEKCFFKSFARPPSTASHVCTNVLPSKPINNELFFLLSDSLSFILFRSHSSHSLRLDHVSHATPLLHGIYYFILFCFNILIELKKVLINPAIQFQQDDIFLHFILFLVRCYHARLVNNLFKIGRCTAKS